MNYHRFSHWQQAEPHYVNRHQDTVQHCHNCGTKFRDNFCPRCGQRAEVGRVGWDSIRENVALLWGLDSRSLTYTLVQLLGRPGYLVRDYIGGHRQVSFPPVKMLVIVSLVAVIAESVFHEHNDVVPVTFNIPEIDNFIKWFNDNKNWGALFFYSLYILPTWIVFRFAPRYPCHTLPEGFFLQVFLSVQSLLLGLLGFLQEGLDTIVGAVYMVVTFRQLFGYGWWGTVWRLAITVLSVMMILLPLVTLGILFAYDAGNVDIKFGFGGREVSLMDAGPALLAIVALLIAVMLFVTHRINKRTYRNNNKEIISNL
ncbi:MAG: DUF3667 domain-containing protein [Prevotella sp.]|nr:DUF3667 domain-containing protein [Prevotella sp.]